MSAGVTALAVALSCGPWPLWEAYARRFVSDEGRVIDRSAGDRTTSEGQAYALFFALVAGDDARFDRVLSWTRDNLAAGDLRANLPAWWWGRDAQGAWRVLDTNAASDADLWIAYTLLEAGRLRRDPALAELGRAVSATIAAREVADLPGLGPMLLPGPVGFALDGGRWRLNPSYLPLPVLRGLADARAPGPWADVRRSTLRLLREGSPRGYAPDWIVWDAARGFVDDPVSGPVGSYDAVRAYLWAAMAPPGDAAAEAVRRALTGPFAHFARHGRVPERVDVRTGAAQGAGPVGFAGALLPGAVRRGDAAAAASLRAALAAARADGLYGQPPAYYDQNLILFATGYGDGWYRFDEKGRLRLRREGCARR